jgi:hypothetical protein
MGHGGIGIGIHPVEGAVQSDTAEVHDALIAFLGDTWGEILDDLWVPEAVGWISLGEDSLLTVEVQPHRVTFWFYDSVEWPRGLAIHWLELVLAGRRYWLDERLRKLGYRLDFSTIPPVRKRLYLDHEDRIGLASREEVQWVVGTPGGSTPHDELPPDLRARVERMFESERCACPLCRELRWNLPAHDEAHPGWAIAVVDWHESADNGWTQVIRHGDELTLVLFSRERSYAWLRGRLGGPWRRVDPEPPGGWTYLALDRRDRTWTTRTAAGHMLQSLDGERWVSIEPEGPPPQARLVGLREAGVWLVSGGALTGPEEGPMRLWRSTDGGRTFTERTGPPTHTRCVSVEGGGPLLAVLCGDELWVSADDGASWRQAELPPELYRVQVLVDEEQEALVVFGSLTPEGVVAGFSYDGGASWEGWARDMGESHQVAAVTVAGRWWWSVVPTGDHAPALFTATELGGRWEPCASAVFDHLFPDPVDPHTVWACNGGAVVRVRPTR